MLKQRARVGTHTWIVQQVGARCDLVGEQELLDALEAVAGPAVRARVRFERDERIAGIVANWPTGARADRAAALGLKPEAQFADIIRQYIADCASNPEALKGMTT